MFSKFTNWNIKEKNLSKYVHTYVCMYNDEVDVTCT